MVRLWSERLSALVLPALIVVIAATGGHAQASGLVLRDLNTSPPLEVELSEAEISALPVREIVTTTDFTDGEIRFEGPLARDVLALVGTGDWTTARMVAANDYVVEIPVSDFERYGVILAHSADGKRLSRRDKGPYWVMYPLDDHEELRDPIYNNRLIWQLVAIELR